MAPPSQLSIATGSLTRLVKEEASYHRELEEQNARIAKLEQGGDSSDENAEYTLRQEVSDRFIHISKLMYLLSRSSLSLYLYHPVHLFLAIRKLTCNPHVPAPSRRRDKSSLPTATAEDPRCSCQA